MYYDAWGLLVVCYCVLKNIVIFLKIKIQMAEMVQVADYVGNVHLSYLLCSRPNVFNLVFSHAM